MLPFVILPFVWGSFVLWMYSRQIICA